jgi:DNA-directed RNA polymerase subunit RPC12/RpoP
VKIECPRCGEQVEYRPGTVQRCLYCGARLRLPEVGQLPEHLRGQWFKEQAAAKAKDEKRRKKLEAAERERKEIEKTAAEKAALLTALREEQQRRLEEERIQAAQRSEENARLRAVAKASEIPERKMVDHYPGVETLKAVFTGIMVISFIIAGIAGLAAIIMVFAEEETVAPGIWLFGFAIGLAFTALWYWCVAELLELAVNLARDAKISRELLTRLVHPDKVE